MWVPLDTGSTVLQLVHPHALCHRATAAAGALALLYRGTGATLQGQASHRAPVGHGSHPLRPVDGAAVLRVKLQHKCERGAWKVGWLAH